MIGLIGCGRWGSKILRDLSALGCSVGVVARSDASIARARDGGAVQIWDSVGVMGHVDGVVVATPTSTHADVIESVLERDVPVFTEKPISPDPERARRLVDQASDRLFVMDKWRYHKGVEAIRDLTTTGEYGALRQLVVRFTSWSRPHTDVDGTWVLLPHVISILLEITGSVPPVRSASGWKTERSGDVDVFAAFGSDVSCVAEISTLRSEYERRVTAHFEEASVTLADGYDQHLTVHRFGRPVGEAGTIGFESAMPLYDELKTFVEYLSAGPAPRSSAHDGLANVLAIHDIRTRLGWEQE